MSNPNQLFLLADHIKLSLLERQRAQTLNLDGDLSKDGHMTRSLDQFRDGLEKLKNEATRLEEAGDEEGALTISENVPGLQKQYDDLTSQFHGFSSPADVSALAQPNDPALGPDFEHATSHQSASASNLRSKGVRSVSKTVRFTDNPASGSGAVDVEAQQLFGDRYRDNPNDEAGYRDEATNMSNQQIHAYHEDILNQQDEQLDQLGASIARQRELSMQIGDELDDHVAMLDDVDAAADRHQGRLDRAKSRVNKIAKAAGESKSMIIIIVLIVILVLLIAVLK